MTWILLAATIGVLGVLAVSCRRAQAEAAEMLCDCLDRRHGGHEGEVVWLHEDRSGDAAVNTRRDGESGWTRRADAAGLRPAG